MFCAINSFTHRRFFHFCKCDESVCLVCMLHILQMPAFCSVVSSQTTSVLDLHRLRWSVLYTRHWWVKRQPRNHRVIVLYAFYLQTHARAGRQADRQARIHYLLKWSLLSRFQMKLIFFENLSNLYLIQSCFYIFFYSNIAYFRGICIFIYATKKKKKKKTQTVTLTQFFWKTASLITMLKACHWLLDCISFVSRSQNFTQEN